MNRNSDVAFTAAVKARQDLYGSRQMAEARDFRDRISQDLAEFLAQCNSLYLATVSEAGRPYIQHRGGRAVSFRFWTIARWALPI